MTADRDDAGALLPILDPAFKADPHPFYAGLREQGGVARMRLPSGAPVWVVSRHDLARELLSDARLSKAARRGDGAAPLHPLFRHLLATDPPLHAELRGVLAPHFTLRRLREFEPRVAALADTLLRGLPRDGRPFDLLGAFAAPLAMAVVCELVGVPDAARATLGRGLDDLDRADLDAPGSVPAIAQQLHDTLTALAARRAALPADSLLATLCAACDAGRVGSAQVAALAFLVLAAGRETTANLIANGVLRLLTRPPGWSALVHGPQHAAALVEELLRLESPLEMATARHAVADIAVGEATTIRAGDTVFVGLAAGNRDPRAFERPGEFDASRDAPARHLAFGHGIHKCLGATLARIEARIALVGLARRCPSLQLAVPPGDLAWKPGLITRGLQDLPVRCASPG